MIKRVSIPAIWVYLCLLIYPIQAQTFGRTPITVENADSLTLMATTYHTVPPIVGLSPDGRWLAVARSIPEGGGPGAGDGYPPYHRPFDHYDADVVLIHDLNNLTDDPQVLHGNNLYVQQMVFTPGSLYLQTMTTDGEAIIREWQFDDDGFIEPRVPHQVDDTIFVSEAHAIPLEIPDVDPEAILRSTFRSKASLAAAIIADGDQTRFVLQDRSTLDIRVSIPRENLSQIFFSADGTKLITVAGFEVAIWSVPENLLTPNGGLILSQQHILAYCDNTEDTPLIFDWNTRLGVVWSWYASDANLVRDHILNAQYDVRIDTYPIYHWVFVSQIRRVPENNNDPTVYYYAPINTALYPVIPHRISYDLTWLNPISDGYADFGAGTANPSNSGECFVNITE